MARLFTPALLLSVAAGVFVYNQRPDRKVVFPLLDRVTVDPTAQGHLTVAILGGLGLLALGLAVAGIVRERRRQDD